MNYTLPIAEIFRAYDIRGIVDNNLTDDVVYTLGLALGSEALARNEKTILLGRDGRLSGPRLATALTAGIMATGCDVIDIGMVATPVLYFAAYTSHHHSGVMLTGSHNPPNYNGLKIMLGGQTLFGEEIQKLYQRILNKEFIFGEGTKTEKNFTHAYIDYIAQQIKLTKPLKIVIDCGNGIAGNIAPQLFKKLGCQVTELFCEVDGNFPNHHPDPSHPDNLKDLIAAIKKTKADIGLAFDGDADRLGVVTERGEIIWPDRQLMVFASDILQQHPNKEIIFDVKCTRHLAKVIQQYNGIPIMWKTGHSFIKTRLQQNKAVLAGEMSGHIFFKDRWFGFDDGMYAGVRLLEILAKQHLSASDLFQQFPDSINTPELKIAIAENQKFSFIEKFVREAKFSEGILSTLDGLRVDFNDGFGLLRASNTSPYLTLRFEADSKEGLQRVQSLFKQQLLQLNPNLDLPF